MDQMIYQSPIGTVVIVEENAAITAIRFLEEGAAPAMYTETPLLKRASQQLAEYFAGQRVSFDLPLAPQGTPFQLSVWAALQTIPYGAVCSYGDIARQIGNAKAYRAVGNANNRNPIAIVIPCHRVIGANGKLVGYGGGLDKKEMLLALEQQAGGHIC